MNLQEPLPEILLDTVLIIFCKYKSTKLNMKWITIKN